MDKIYLGFWKNLSYLEMTERAAVVLALKSVFYLVIVLLLLLSRQWLVDFIYLIVNAVYERLSFRKSFQARAAASNRIAGSYRAIHDKMAHMRLKRWIIAIFVLLSVRYFVLVAFISYAPEISEEAEQTYLGSIIVGTAEKYQKYETDKLQQAEDYQPLMPVDSMETEQSGQAEDSEQLLQEEIWLSLSKKGKKGTNVKKKPSQKSKRIASVSGKDRVLFLERNKDGWVKVQLKNGKKGWVNEVFLKGIPDAGAESGE